MTDGCPQWRMVDELRATKRNWFVMYQKINQYVWLASPEGAYQEDVIPAHSARQRQDILYWDLIPLWKLRGRYTPQQRIFNSALEELPAEYQSPRHQRMDKYLQARKPKWGRNVDQIIDDPEGWDADQFPPAPKKMKIVQ